MTGKGIQQKSRKDRERERHRREILAAAERIFARKGYHATTIEEIAKEAEFAVGTLYNLFEGKDDLYARVIEAFVQDFMKTFEQKVLGLENAEQAIGALIELRLTHFHAHREFIRVAFATSPESRMVPARLLPPHLLALRDRYMEAVTQVFQRGINQQIFDNADPLYFTLCLEGTIHAFVAYWSQHPPTESLITRIARMKREFLGRIKMRLEAGAP